MEKLKLSALAAHTQAKRGRLKALAEALGVSDSYLSQMISGKRPMPAELCPKVEAFSKGAVSRRQCRPNDGHLIWPEVSTVQHDNSDLHRTLCKRSHPVAPPTPTTQGDANHV